YFGGAGELVADEKLKRFAVEREDVGDLVELDALTLQHCFRSVEASDRRVARAASDAAPRVDRCLAEAQLALSAVARIVEQVREIEDPLGEMRRVAAFYAVEDRAHATRSERASVRCFSSRRLASASRSSCRARFGESGFGSPSRTCFSGRSGLSAQRPRRARRARLSSPSSRSST